MNPIFAMRAELALLSIILLASLSAMAAPGMTVPTLVSATSQAEINSWGKSHSTSFSTESIEIDNKSLFLLVVDVGSGLSIKSAYLYLHAGSQWTLIAVRHTNSSVIKADS